MLKLANDLFYSEMLNAIRLSFSELSRQLADERVYGYSICLEPLGSYVGAYGGSEEGLARLVEECRQKGLYTARKGDLNSLLATSLRWDCEGGWLPVFEPYFDKANQVLSEAYDSDPEAFYDLGYTRLVYLTCLRALAETDADGLFGRGEEREAITLNLYLGDQSDEELLRWASQVNCYEVYASYRAALAAESAAHAQLIFHSPD